MTLASGDITATVLVASLAGGIYTIESSLVSASSYILVNGLRGDLVHVENILHHYEIPELLVSDI